MKQKLLQILMLSLCMTFIFSTNLYAKNNTSDSEDLEAIQVEEHTPVLFELPKQNWQILDYMCIGTHYVFDEPVKIRSGNNIVKMLDCGCLQTQEIGSVTIECQDGTQYKISSILQSSSLLFSHKINATNCWVYHKRPIKVTSSNPNVLTAHITKVGMVTMDTHNEGSAIITIKYADGSTHISQYSIVD